MKSKIHISFQFFLILILILLQNNISASNNSEQAIQVIELSGPIANSKSELSGLAWYGDNLILLPQYPDSFSLENNGCVFSLSKKNILDYLFGKNKTALKPKKINFSAPDFNNILDGFEGYEAICFSGNNVFLTIEVENNEGVESYLIKGEITTNLNEIKLDSTSLTKIPFDLNISNMAHETVTIIKNKIIAIYEANGKNVNINPKANQFDFFLKNVEQLDFPPIEYRITDATDVDQNGFFWVINYFYPGDKAILKPGLDKLSQQYGQGQTHQQNEAVERLVKLQMDTQGIHLSNTPPIQIELNEGKDSRNWEGLVKLDEKGFLLATDKFPETILAFIPFPDPANKIELKIYENNGKYGFTDTNGKEIIPAQFIMAQDFSTFGIAAVIDDSGWVYINKKGEKLIRPFIVDNGPDYFSKGLARYIKDGKIGFFDEYGNIVIKAQFDYAKPFLNGKAEVCNGCYFKTEGEHTRVIDGNWKYINKSGKVVSE